MMRGRGKVGFGAKTKVIEIQLYEYGTHHHRLLLTL